MRDLRNEFDAEAPRCRGGYLEDAPTWIWGHPDWVIEPKQDGIRVTLQIGKEGSLMVGRNRQDFLKGVARAKEFRCLNEINPYLAAIANEELDGTMLDGEVTETYAKGKYDKYTQVRVENGLWVGFVVWQCLFVKYQDVRHFSDADRRELARRVIVRLERQGITRVRLIERVPATIENAEAMMAKGLEGVVAKNQTAPVPIGQRTNPHWFKIKGSQKRTVDAFVIGVTEAMSGGSGVRDEKRRKNGKAATLTVGMYRDGQIVEVAKVRSLPDDVVERAFKHFDEFRFRVIEFKVSGWDGERFRWPMFVKWRPDKSPNDCLWSEQMKEK